MTSDLPRLTFGLIVLNGEPFVRYNLCSIYPFAHQIIVVEGAVPAAAEIATPNGHSTDGTLEALRNFKANEDTENKVTIVTAEDEGYPNGFWPGEKHEQSQAYARRATGSYLWQIDIDEFYKPEDMQQVIVMLRDDPSITAVSFKQITFWGGFDYITDGWYLRQGAEIYRRLFKWGPDYRYVTHRPPNVYNSQGLDVNTLRPISGYEMARRGVFLYHYSLLFPKQVLEKTKYYSQAEWAPHACQAQAWTNSNYLKLEHPFRAHNVYQYVSWLERYRGEHPPEIVRLRNDIAMGKVAIELRQTDDIECLLATPWYMVARWGVKAVAPVWLFLRRGKRKLRI